MIPVVFPGDYMRGIPFGQYSLTFDGERLQKWTRHVKNDRQCAH